MDGDWGGDFNGQFRLDPKARSACGEGYAQKGASRRRTYGKLDKSVLAPRPLSGGQGSWPDIANEPPVTEMP